MEVFDDDSRYLFEFRVGIWVLTYYKIRKGDWEIDRIYIKVNLHDPFFRASDSSVKYE